jgi:predicted PP-loop superfamily ATPase
VWFLCGLWREVRLSAHDIERSCLQRVRREDEHDTYVHAGAAVIA